MTDTVVQELVINTLTQAQFDAAKGAGTLSPYELYGTPDTSVRLPVLTPMWFDHIANDMSWLRADTFSWHSGDVYKAAYEHLADDFKSSLGDGSGGVVSGLPHVDTIGDITIAYYLAQDGHKICLPDQESNLVALYEATGVAWYYLLDTTTKQFKLPRTKWGFTGLRDSVGGYVAPGLPNITASWRTVVQEEPKTCSGAVSTWTNGEKDTTTGGGGYNNGSIVWQFNANRSNAIYGNSDTVQPKATQMYLYFFVGNFEQDAVEQTAGINAEMFNDLNAHKVIEFQSPTADNGYTWYRKYADGWVEQGGLATIPSRTNSGNSVKNVSLPVQMEDSTYVGQISYQSGGNYFANCMLTLNTKTQTSVALNFYMNATGTTAAFEVAWEVKGKAKE